MQHKKHNPIGTLTITMLNGARPYAFLPVLITHPMLGIGEQSTVLETDAKGVFLSPIPFGKYPRFRSCQPDSLILLSSNRMTEDG